MSAYWFLDRPIAFHRSFIDLGVGVTGALFLSQSLYWSRRTKDRDGWFYKTGVEWQEETGLTRREQDGARNRLKKVGVLEEIKRGVPCRVHYRVNIEKLDLIMSDMAAQKEHQFAQNRQTGLHKTANTVCAKPPNKLAQNSQTISETTTEITNKETTTLFPDEPKTEKKQARQNKVSMPSDFKPTAQHDELAKSLGVNLGHEFDQFADYHAAKQSRYVDWHAALRTWIRNAAKWSKSKSPNKPGYFRDEAKSKNYWEGIDDEGRF